MRSFNGFNGGSFFGKYWLVIALLAGVVVLMGSCSVRNGFVSHEAGIKAQQSKIEGNLAANFEHVATQSGLKNEHKALYLQTLELMTKHRGNMGAVMNVVAESNPSLDPEIFKSLRRAVELTYNEIKADQTDLIDRVRAYETSLKRFPASMVASLAGYPTIDLAEAGKPISNDAAQKMVTGKKFEPLPLK